VVDETTALVGSTGDLLYAPAHVGHCFSVQVASYGRSRTDEPTSTDLPPSTSFYRLPPIDAWFEPNPPAGEGTEGWSGGVRRALRMRECD
jgi:hypothetical protein